MRKEQRDKTKDMYKGKSYKLTNKVTTKSDINKAYKKEDYTEVIKNLSRSERNSLNRAYRDLDFYSKGSKEYRNAKSYIDEMEAKAMLKHKSKKK